MNLKSYLDLYALLGSDNSSRSERRTFGLSHSGLKNSPVEQLLKWTDVSRHSLKRPLLSETLTTYLYGITLTLTVIAFLLGFFSGVGLLSYSGHEPVNVIYFIAMVIFIPLFTMLLALLSMFKANSNQSMLIHISPAFWMEKLLSLFPNRLEEQLKETVSELKLNPLIMNWLVIKRSQMIALAFSFGLFLALMAMVSTRDIAFAWSTTLSVTPDAFHHFLTTLAFAWRDLFPWALPSVDLVEQSQYYRLGEKLGDEMINNASLLGEWWKFLAFATLFYAILLRMGMLLLSHIGLQRAIGKSFLTLEGSQKLLNDMNEPIISTSAKEAENDFNAKNIEYPRTINHLDASYDVLLGWAIDKERLIPLADSMNVLTPYLIEVGGGNSLAEDREILNQCHGEVLLYVKAWEPPTMDFVDFVEMLLQKTDKVIVVPVGTEAKAYSAKESEVNVWARKLFTLNSDKIWLKV